MRNHVNRTEFLQRLEAVQAGLSPSEIIDQASCFVFQGGRVITFNLETACRFKSTLHKDFTGAVKAPPLLAILRKLVEEELILETTDSELVIVGKRRRAGIIMEADIKLPVDKLEKPEAWTPLDESFADAVSIVMPCVDRENEYPRSCVHVCPQWVEACNPTQMARFRLPTGVSAPTLVKKESIQHVVSLDMTEMSETPNWLHFRNPSGLILSCCRYTDVSDYPDLKPFFAAKGVKIQLPKGLGNAADKAAIFSGEEKDDNYVLVEIKPGKLRVRGEGASGWYTEIKNVNYTGRPLSFQVAPKILIELAKKHTECEIADDKLKVDGGKFRYVSCLGSQEEESDDAE